MEKNFSEVVFFWQAYFDEHSDWGQLVKKMSAKNISFGYLYEMALPMGRSCESWAIADMSDVSYSTPHYHKETEIYFVLEGAGTVVVGGKEIQVNKGDSVLTPPNTVHFTISDGDLVLGVVNCPPFQGEILISETDLDLKFDKEKFKRLTDFYSTPEAH